MTIQELWSRWYLEWHVHVNRIEPWVGLGLEMENYWQQAQEMFIESPVVGSIVDRHEDAHIKSAVHSRRTLRGIMSWCQALTEGRNPGGGFSEGAFEPYKGAGRPGRLKDSDLHRQIGRTFGAGDDL